MQKLRRKLQVLFDIDLIVQIMSKFTSGETIILCARDKGIGFQCVQAAKITETNINRLNEKVI